MTDLPTPTAQLANVRSTAQKWRDGLAVSTVIAAAAAYIAGPDEIDRLAPVAQGWFLAVAGITGVLAFASLVTSLLASIGFPEMAWAGQVDEATRDKRDRAIKLLKASVATGILAIIGALIAIAILLLGGTVAAEKITVELTTGTAQCYEKAVQSDDELLLINGDLKVPVDPSTVVKITVGCAD